MDDIDRRILSALQKDGRITISDLSSEIGLSPTPLARRIDRLERDGVITGYSARVDPARIGRPVTIFISLELDRQDKNAIETFERAIARLEEVMECHLMTGSRDILLRVVAADLADFDRFLEERLMKIDGIRNMRSNFALRTMVARKALPL